MPEKITPEAIEREREWLRKEARRAAIKAWERCTFHGVGARCHLVYRAGELLLVPEDDATPAGYSLARPRALSIGSRTIDQISNDVHEIARGLPCLPAVPSAAPGA